MIKKNLSKIIAGTGLYLFTTGISAWAFGAFNSSTSSGPISPAGGSISADGSLNIDPAEPKDQVCPINGQMFTKIEKAVWEQRRPVLVMLENAVDARPQSGISSADVVYEAVAEGGITRFMGVFYCTAAAKSGKVAPVRSARIYFVNIAQEYNDPVYVHVGGGNCSRDQVTEQCVSDKRAWAVEELSKIGWRKPKGNDFDTIGDIGVPVLYRDKDRLGPDKTLAVEHTMVGSLSNVWEEAVKRGFTGEMKDGSKWLSGFQKWTFTDSSAESDRGDVSSISFEFWTGYKDFDVKWEYDQAANQYKRFTGGQSHLDLENNQQLKASNVIIQFAKEEGPIDPNKHMLYQIIGKGNAIVFQNGKSIEATWEKAKSESRTVLKDKKGKEISFVRGPIWVEIVPANNSIEY